MIELFFDLKSILLEFLYLLADYELSRIHNDCTINNRNYQVVYCMYRLKISNLEGCFSHNINSNCLCAIYILFRWFSVFYNK